MRVRRILAINGSYRDDGLTDQAIAVLLQAARDGGADVEEVRLRDTPIEFCLNCRACTQEPGEQPGECVQQDAMSMLVAKIEQADALIFASPTNFGGVTALFKRFMERLIVYGWWPWGSASPKGRKSGLPQKPALLVASSAAPALLGRFTFSTVKQLKATARTVGARPVGTLYTGLASLQQQPSLPARSAKKAQQLIRRLL